MTPLKLVGPLRASKKFVIEDGQCAGLVGTPQDNGAANQGPPSPLVIKLNNFLLWSSSGCVLPYMSVYFLRYTQANSNDVGHFMSISALVGTFVNFLLSSLSDRYQAHRRIYLISLILVNLSLGLLLVPILTSDRKTGEAFALVEGNETSTTRAPHGEQQQETTTTKSLSEEIEDERTIDQDQPIWFYVIGFCIAFGSLSITTNMNFSDSFSTNIARQRPNVSYGSLRFYGAIGWCVSNFLLSLVNRFESVDLPYLLPAWTLFALLSSANILLILAWPSKRPFDLSSSSSDEEETPPLDGAGGGNSCKEKQQHQRLSPRAKQPVFLTKAEMLTFDALEERILGARPQVRRCSIAPLGSSHLIEQFEVNPPRPRDEEPAGTHFKHITKIEPLRLLEGGAHVVESELERQVQLFQREQELSSSSSKPAAGPKKSMSFRLHLKIIELIARRNKNIFRCISLYAVVGFIVSMNWYFLFPYLELLDSGKFLTISGYVMMSTYASETVFYYFASSITNRVSATNGLSVILFVFALRNSTYLTFAWWPQTCWPLELIILVECLQSLTMGWFDCIFNESALEFALEAEKCVPKLIELGLIEDTPESVRQVKNGVKLSLLSVSSCFFDGLGVGLGSLAGGFMIEAFGYAMLWTFCASVALTVCLANIALELTLFSGGGGGDSVAEVGRAK